MLSIKIGLPQYQLSPPKAQIPAYFQKLLDIKITGCNINSATQQLSNSATQQLSNSATRLCPDKRAYFSFRQQHNHFFSYIFADGKRAVNLFHIKPQRAPRMRRQIEENIPFKTLASSASLRLIKIKPLSIQRSQRKVEKKFNKSSLFRSFAGSAFFFALTHPIFYRSI